MRKKLAMQNEGEVEDLNSERGTTQEDRIWDGSSERQGKVGAISWDGKECNTGTKLREVRGGRGVEGRGGEKN